MNILFDYQKSYIIDSSGARQQSPIYLSYQSKPTWIISLKTVENTVSNIDLSDAVTWSSAVDKDFNSTTEPMVRTLNTDIDNTDAVNGNISIILDTGTTTFQDAIGTSRTINAYFELRGFNSSGDEIYYIQFKIIALNKLDTGTGDPLDPVENYYTIAQVDALNLTKENSLNNPLVDDYILSSKIDGTRSWVAMAGGGAVDSVNGATGVVVLNQDNIIDGINFVQYSTTEKSKLANTPTVFAQTDAQKNSDITKTEIENKLIGEISTHSHDLSSLAIKTNVLELDNTTSFTPTTDYNPATKKYVDDNSSSGGSSTEVNIETLSADKTLTSSSKAIQILDGGSTDRNIDMYDATANVYHNFTNSGATNNLIIKKSSTDIIISGAGATVYDGTYIKQATQLDNSDWYLKNDGSLYGIRYFLDFPMWAIILLNSSGYAMDDEGYSNGAGAGAIPLTGWAVGSIGVTPVPTITLASATYATLKPTESVKIASEVDAWAVAEQINRGSKIYDNGSQSGSVSLDFSNGDYQQLSTIASDPILGVWINNSVSGDKLEIEFDNTNATTVNINSIRMIETIDTGKYIITMRNILGIIRVDKTKVEIK